MFVKSSDGMTTIVLIYVNDIIIITGNNENEINKVKTYLKNKFDIKDLGKLKYFWGIEITHSKAKCLFLS
jgi:Reverse transcriptase (RNA-dependent DNA polymerase)